MLTWIRRLLIIPAFEDEETTRIARLLNIMLLTIAAAVALTAIAVPVVSGLHSDFGSAFTMWGCIVVLIIILSLLVLARRGRLALASGILLTCLWALMSGWVIIFAGLTSDRSVMGFGLIIVLTGLLMGGRAAIVMTLLSNGVIVVAFFADIVRGNLPVPIPSTQVFDLIVTLTITTMTGLLMLYAMNSLSNALERARQNERAQIRANRELQAIRASLEDRVAARTSDLERRSKQLQAAAEVSQTTTSILETEELLLQAVELIREQFALYHVGLFLLDEAGEWAVYRAGAGAIGRELRKQGFRLEVGSSSMVGWCTANAQVHVAQDVRTEEIYVDHELVPETRSEAALPLIARGQVIGALSVQSNQVGTFDRDTVAALRTMADQVAVAIDNARLFAESQQALEAMRRAYGELSRQAWTELLRTRADWGYSFDLHAVMPVQGGWQPEMLQAMQSGQPAEGSSAETGSGLAIPLRVREEVVGVLSFYKDSSDEMWTARETELLRRLVTQLGVALESAQLFEETQRRAAREQSIRQVTEQMQSAVGVEDILQSTVAELARALGAPRAYVRLGTEAELLDARRVPPASGPARQQRPDLIAAEQDSAGYNPLDTAGEQDQGDN